MKAQTRRVQIPNALKPNAWIVNPTDRGRKSIKSNNKVYLQDGQEFQIELHNPLTESVLADVKVNGQSVSKTGLVLRPAERFYLDCFIDDKKKFIFKTYEVENTKESKDSIVKNGTVEVFFYKEETFSLNNWKNKFDRVIERVYYPEWYPVYYPVSFPVYPKIWGGRPFNDGIIYGNTSNPIVGTTTTVNYGGNSLTSNISNSAASYTVNMNSQTGDTFNTTYTSSLEDGNLNAYFSTDKIETGRVEKGEKSKQEFTEVDLEFQSYHISSVMYQILPESQKPVETAEIKKKFCTECSQKLKGTEKFCPECGGKI